MKHSITILLALLFFSCKPTPVSRAVDPVKKTNKMTDMKFSNKVIDFGTVKGDTLLTGRYDFKNTGSNDLFISSVNPDCTCTGFYLSNDTIPPGDSAYILLKMATKNKTGNVVIYATVGANTETRLYNLTLKAKF